VKLKKLYKWQREHVPFAS